MPERWNKLREWIGFRIALAGLYIAPRWYHTRIKGFIVAGMRAERAEIEREALIGQSINARYDRGTTDGS